MDFSNTIEILMTEEEFKNYEGFRSVTKPEEIEDSMFDRQLFFAGADWLSKQLTEQINDAIKKGTIKPDAPDEAPPEEEKKEEDEDGNE